MKTILLITILSSAALLAGCTNMGCSQGGGGCGYYDYPSQCGLPSCTDNTYIIEFSNPCPGPYDCMVVDP
ncbi:hypothetical protein AQUSIP_09320 [Aquicella siphonis]|uniref:Kazal-like domain-containing protein n=1 Tax=Aquicella siphonis TaxID=254247 RepID=A0A5E4PGN5_9COXI|nr:hypothetical protein [Aquicella siphonis]VVC75642.1 hypothetical protein AQUSIP_09320 [Aquicella siphonis]